MTKAEVKAFITSEVDKILLSGECSEDDAKPLSALLHGPDKGLVAELMDEDKPLNRKVMAAATIMLRHAVVDMEAHRKQQTKASADGAN